MASQALSYVFGVSSSLTGCAWRWRGGNMELGNTPGLDDDIVRQLLLSRGVAAEDIERHRNPTLRNFLPDPSLFRDMDVAADRIAQAVIAGETITIYGDYDVDGVTSMAMLMRMLRFISPEAQLEAYVPHRLEEGYGLNGAALEGLRSRGTDLVITVDCGVTAEREISIAADLGMDLIITITTKQIRRLVISHNQYDIWSIQFFLTPLSFFVII